MASDDPDSSWLSEAPCRGLADVFFPPTELRPDEREERVLVAKAICERCPFRTPCFWRAVRYGAADGVWGGFCFPREGRAEARRLRALGGG